MEIKKIIFLITIAATCFLEDAGAQNRRAGKETYSFDALPAVQAPVFKKDTFNIRTYGALADGSTLNTAAIDRAITACSKSGGGVVLIPRGIWITGPLELKSNVNLRLEANALLQFTSDHSQYKLTEGDWEGKPCARNQSPLSAVNAVNIAITGKGIIDGNGDAWRAVKKDKLTGTQWKTLVASGGVLDEDKKNWYPSQEYMLGAKTKNAGELTNGKTVKDYESMKAFFRPNLLVFNGCSKVLLEGVTFQNSPAWCLHLLVSKDISVKNVVAKNPWYAQNGDGIDLESCANVVLENSTFDVGDDGICLKSGRDEAGRKRGIPSENIVVRNCTVYHAHGGVVIGSEMSGGVRNVFVLDCTFLGTDIGLRFKTTRGRGGIVEKIYVKDIVMKDIVGDAILFDMYYSAKDPVALDGEQREEPKAELLPVTEATPQFRDFDISHIVCLGAGRAIFVRGLPEMNIKDIRFRDLAIQSGKGIEITEGSHISLDQVQVTTTVAGPVVLINNADNISFNGIRYTDKADLLFGISGERTAGIKVMNTDVSKALNKVTFSGGATDKALDIQ